MTHPRIAAIVKELETPAPPLRAFFTDGMVRMLPAAVLDESRITALVADGLVR